MRVHMCTYIRSHVCWRETSWRSIGGEAGASISYLRPGCDTYETRIGIHQQSVCINSSAYTNCVEYSTASTLFCLFVFGKCHASYKKTEKAQWWYEWKEERRRRREEGGL